MTVQLGEPRLIESGALMIAGLAKRYTPDKLSFLPAQWTQLRNQLQFVTGIVDGKLYGIWNDVMSGGGIFTYFAGAQVGEYAPIHPALSRMYIVGQRYAVFPHRGPVSEVRRTAEAAVSQWLPKSGRQHARPDPEAPDFLEVYGEHFDFDAGQGDVEVWLPVK